MKNLIKYAVESGVVYHAVNYNLQRCEKGCMTIGRKEKCELCGSKIVDNFIRVVGFLTRVKSWNEVRREEDYAKRQFYKNVDKIQEV